MPSARGSSANSSSVAAPALSTLPPIVAAHPKTVAPLLSACHPVPQYRSQRRPYALPLTAALPIAVARAAEPLHPSSVLLRPLPQRPYPRCRRFPPPARFPPTDRRCPLCGVAASFVDTPLAGVAERSRRQRCCSPSSLPAPPIAVFLVARAWHSSSAPSTRCTRRRCSPLPPRACVLAHSAPAPTVEPSGGAASGQILFPARFRQAHPTKAPRRVASLPSRFSHSGSRAGPWPTDRHCPTAAAAPHCRRIAPG